MGAVTAISWCDHTWNPWIGCTRVSPACDGCYADALMGAEGRHKRATWGGPGKGAGTRSRTKTGADPIRWNRAAEEAGTRPFVFCASLSDIFDNEVDPDWRAEAFATMRRTPRLVYLLLTKRPGLIERLAREAGGLPSNAAIGCTVVTQEEAERDVPKLLIAKRALAAAFAFVSMEPLLGPVDLTTLDQPGGWTSYDALRSYSDEQAVEESGGPDAVGYAALDWVISGGETDQGSHRARPSHPQWFRDLRDQCAAAGVPYHHKQNGEWAPGECAPKLPKRSEEAAWWFDDRWDFQTLTPAQSAALTFDDEPTVFRMGKAAAGRTLDGVVHDARPRVPA